MVRYCLILVFLITFLGGGVTAFPGQESSLQPRVLLIPFKVNGPDKGIELTSRLLRVLSERLRSGGEILVNVAAEIAPEAGADQLKAAGMRAGAALVVYGSLTFLGDTLSVDARLFNSVDSSYSPPVFAEGSAGDLDAKVGELADNLATEIKDAFAKIPEEVVRTLYGQAGAPFKWEVAEAVAEAKRPAAKPPTPAKPAKRAKLPPVETATVKAGVLPFKVNAGDSLEESRQFIFKELSQQLVRGGQVALVGQDKAKEFLADPARIDYNQEGLKRLAQEIGAEYLVYGSLTRLGDSMSLDTVLLHLPEGGEPALARVSVEGTGSGDLKPKVEDLAFELKRRMLKGQIIITPLEERAPAAARPSVVPEPQKKEVAKPREVVAKTKPEPAPKAQMERVPKESPGKEGAAKKERRGLMGDSSAPITISSRRLEADNKTQTVTFRGDVVAKREDMVITSDVMIATYEAKGRQVDKIVAQGNVKMTQGDRVATGQTATFYNEEQKVILTGSPVVKQGQNTVSGESITVFLNEDRMVVESGERHRVNATIYPGSQ